MKHSSASMALALAVASLLACAGDGEITAPPPPPPSSSITITSITPDPIVEGAEATLTGDGFSATASQNEVTIDGVEATVTQASETRLTVLVPTFDCRPARRASVRVSTGGETSAAVGHSLKPLSVLPEVLEPGELYLLRDPGEFCIQLGETTDEDEEEYLVGVQAISEALGSRTSAVVTGVGGSGPASAAIVPSPAATRLPDVTASGWLAGDPPPILYGREAHFEQLQGYLRRGVVARSFPGFPVPAQATASPVPGPLSAGDEVQINIPLSTPEATQFETACNSFEPITAVVREVGQQAIWLEDVSNPDGGFSASHIRQFRDLLDDVIWPVLVDYFGDPSDIDGNGRVAIVISKVVNAEGRPAFTSTLDFFDESCSASNIGELMYLATPDPNNEIGAGVTASPEELFTFLVPLVGHTLTHTIQFSRRIFEVASPPSHDLLMLPWIAEGQAQLAEEVVGHAVTGNRPGRDYGGDIAFVDPGDFDWYGLGFIGMSRYFGFDTETVRTTGAPEECSWLLLDPAPCVGGGMRSSVSWSLLRWISDHWGPGYPGGEQGLHRDLIGNLRSGFENVSALLGVEVDDLLAAWAAMLYADGRLAEGSELLRMPSWDLADVFGSLPETARLTPRQASFADFSERFEIADGSTGYLRLSGTGPHAPVAIRARTPADARLPGHMRLWVVRLR